MSDNIAYAEDGSVIYPAGHNVVLYSPDTKTQRLIPGTLESEGITAICVSANKKLLAVAERSEKAMITVFDLQTLKKRKVLMAADAGSKVSINLLYPCDHVCAFEPNSTCAFVSGVCESELQRRWKNACSPGWSTRI